MNSKEITTLEFWSLGSSQARPGLVYHIPAHCLQLSREGAVLRQALEALTGLYRLEQTEEMSKRIWKKIFTEAPSAECQRFQFCLCVICVSGWTNAWHGFSLPPQKGFFLQWIQILRCELMHTPSWDEAGHYHILIFSKVHRALQVCVPGRRWSRSHWTEFREVGLCSEWMLDSLLFGLNRNWGRGVSPVILQIFVLLHRTKELHTTSLRDEQFLLLITL